MSVRRVYGEPYESGGAMVIPAASIRGGGGGGGGSGEDDDGGRGEGSGMGYGIKARPVGAWVIKEGNARWHIAIDVNRVITGWQIVVAIYIVTNWLTQRGRNKAQLKAARRR